MEILTKPYLSQLQKVADSWAIKVKVVECNVSFQMNVEKYAYVLQTDLYSKLTHHRRKVIFTPNSDLKDELKATSISITCYDRNGKLVKRVTSTDVVEVDDSDNEGGDDPSASSGQANGGIGGSGGNQLQTLIMRQC